MVTVLDELTRYNNFDIPRPPKKFGVRWDKTNSDPDACLTRLDDAVGMTVAYVADTADYGHYNSDFDDYYPWAGMVRMEMWYQGDIQSIDGELDEAGTSAFRDTTAGTCRVMVRIPKFWYHTTFVDANTVDMWISPFPMKGFRVHPAFLRTPTYGDEVSGIVENVYVGAFEGYNDGTHLYSYAGVVPSVSATRATFRTRAAATGTNYRPLDYQTWNAIQWLYLIEYASFDSQTALGAGMTHANAITPTGFTSSVGHDLGTTTGGGHDKCALSGKVRVCSGYNTTGGGLAGSDDWAMSYRGIENLWGNTHTILDGINISTGKIVWIYEYGLTFADQTPPASDYNNTFITCPAAAGYIQYPISYTVQDKPYDWLIFFPYDTVGGSAATYLCDYYELAADWTTPVYPKVGGAYADDTKAGIFSMELEKYAYTGADTGTRLMMVNQDNTGYYVY